MPATDQTIAERAPQAPPLRWRHVRATIALILREMATRYGKSPGGYAWAVLEPLGAIVILSVGFSLVMRSPGLGNSFLLFYATGYLPYDLFQKLSGKMAVTLIRARAMLAYPTVSWFDAIAASFILTFLTSVLVSFLLLIGIFQVQDITLIVSYGPVLTGFALATILGTGIGLVNGVLTGFFPVWASIWSILTRPLLIASGVIILYRDLPVLAQNILYYNPLLHVSGLVRRGFYPTYRAEYVSVPFVLGTGLGLVALGLALMRRYHREILNR